MASTMYHMNGSDVLLTAGGISIKDRTTRYELLNNMFSYKNEGDKMAEKTEAGNFRGKIGAYSNLMEIPRVPGKDKSGALLFAGNTDFRTDIDRQQFCNVYKWVYKVKDE